MAIWLVRAGKHGQHEQRFLNDSRIYLTWGGLHTDLTKVASKADLKSLLQRTYPEASNAKLGNWTGQIWAFVDKMKKGDWVLLPSKHRPAIHVGEVMGPCEYAGAGGEWDFNYRKVRWFGRDVPRSNFDQDVLYSLGAFLTVCQIERNDAERRIRHMAENDWKSEGLPNQTALVHEDELHTEQEQVDLERVARDEIAQLILSKLKGHGMARLVNAILQAQGYTTYLSPEGPDKGVDILAAPAPMGFGEPRLCVQVKSGDSPLERTTLDQLIGAMQNVHATQGLLVSWGGFKASIDREVANQFFRVRLWDQDDLIAQFLNNYEQLDAELRAELPLKRIWTVASPDEEL